jgi:hypothetical protein
MLTNYKEELTKWMGDIGRSACDDCKVSYCDNCQRSDCEDCWLVTAVCVNCSAKRGGK